MAISLTDTLFRDSELVCQSPRHSSVPWQPTRNYSIIHVSVSLCQLSCQCEALHQERRLLGKGQEDQVKRTESIPATDLLVKLSEVFNTNGSQTSYLQNRSQFQMKIPYLKCMGPEVWDLGCFHHWGMLPMCNSMSWI